MSFEAKGSVILLLYTCFSMKGTALLKGNFPGLVKAIEFIWKNQIYQLKQYQTQVLKRANSVQKFRVESSELAVASPAPSSLATAWLVS